MHNVRRSDNYVLSVPRLISSLGLKLYKNYLFSIRSDNYALSIFSTIFFTDSTDLKRELLPSVQPTHLVEESYNYNLN